MSDWGVELTKAELRELSERRFDITMKQAKRIADLKSEIAALKAQQPVIESRMCPSCGINNFLDHCQNCGIRLATTPQPEENT